MPYHTIGTGRKRVRRPPPDPSPEPEVAVVRVEQPGGSFARWSGPVCQWLSCDAGLRPVKLVVLVGHPGVGKTYCARHLLGQHCARFEECAASQFVRSEDLCSHLAKFVFDGKRVHGLLLDEFDALLGPDAYERFGQWLLGRGTQPMHPIIATCNSFHDRAQKAFLEKFRAVVMRVTVPKPSVVEMRQLVARGKWGGGNVEWAVREADGDVRRVQRLLAGQGGVSDCSRMDFFSAVSAMCTGHGSDEQRARYAQPDVRVWVETHVLPAQMLFGADKTDIEAAAQCADVLSVANVLSVGGWPDTEMGDVLTNYAAVPAACRVPGRRSSMWLTQNELCPRKGVAGMLRDARERMEVRLSFKPNTLLPPPPGHKAARSDAGAVHMALHYPHWK